MLDCAAHDECLLNASLQGAVLSQKATLNVIKCPGRRSIGFVTTGTCHKWNIQYVIGIMHYISILTVSSSGPEIISTG